MGTIRIFALADGMLFNPIDRNWFAIGLNWFAFGVVLWRDCGRSGAQRWLFTEYYRYNLARDAFSPR